MLPHESQQILWPDNNPGTGFIRGGMACLPVCTAQCASCADVLLAAGSELASCLSRSIQQSYHAVQEQFLAQARELLLPDNQKHAESVVVGQPLPLDTEFLKRTKDNKAQVGRTTYAGHHA
jgi:hypothetical protein